ncbi:MAG: hypothetical protein OEU09_21190 [Rhodospirillales bacterium]|nr:hypothetical protein [Rhodospirillales bacterium]MDH3913802.1 hypothetical protein [Rhodospirillales bacterium]MDH3920070.1 hypothetical protein [Rhodospirillales bacterium]MDH3968630.1 hypothetical protein [Rhodospirillales bacterium]
MPLKLSVFLAALLGMLMVAGAARAACEDGQVLKLGQTCEITIKWGYDHWVRAEFPDDGKSYIEFGHIEGKCNVSLFGPAEETTLTPDQAPTRSSQPGDYHLFTRAMTIAREACRYKIAVD